MKRLILPMAVALLLISAPATAGGPQGAEQSHGWCSLDGAWFGYSGFGPWTATITMTSPNEGVGTTVWSGGTGTWFGFCPDAVGYSIAQGTFTRTGPRSFDFTSITFSYAADNSVACIWKNSGWVEVDRGCTTGTLNATVELYAPDQNPFDGGVPYVCFPPGPDNSTWRMTVDPSCS